MLRACALCTLPVSAFVSGFTRKEAFTLACLLFIRLDLTENGVVVRNGYFFLQGLTRLNIGYIIINVILLLLFESVMAIKGLQIKSMWFLHT
jgi:hypothetical protein